MENIMIWLCISESTVMIHIQRISPFLAFRVYTCTLLTNVNNKIIYHEVLLLEFCVGSGEKLFLADCSRERERERDEDYHIPLLLKISYVGLLALGIFK